jgi:hypothetical protein
MDSVGLREHPKMLQLTLGNCLEISNKLSNLFLTLEVLIPLDHPFRKLNQLLLFKKISHPYHRQRLPDNSELHMNQITIY